MCPACMASAAMMIVTVMSTGGLTAVVMKKLGTKNVAEKSVPNSKEETWEK
jgi:hypothetical protein